MPPIESTRRDAGLEHAGVARERHVDARLVVEVEDEHFVLRIGRAHERERRRLDLRPQRPHAAAVVDQQSERDGDVVVPEQRDRLPLAVLVDGERAALERGDELAARVPDRGVDDDQPRLRVKGGRLRAGRRLHRERQGDRGGGLHSFCEGPGASRTWIGVSAGEHDLAPLAQHVRVHRASGAVDAHRDADGPRDLADGRAEESHADESADEPAAGAGAGGLDRPVAVGIGDSCGRRARLTRAAPAATAPAR